MTTNNNNQRGIALVAALFWASALLFLGTTFCLISVVESRIVHNEVSGERAFQLAEAGIDHARRALVPADLTAILDGTAGYGPAGTPPFGPSVDLADGTYGAVISNNDAANGFPRGTIQVDPSGSATVDGDDIFVITSTGSYQGGRRIVEVIAQQPEIKAQAAISQLDGPDAGGAVEVEDFEPDDGARIDGRDCNPPSLGGGPGPGPDVLGLGTHTTQSRDDDLTDLDTEAWGVIGINGPGDVNVFPTPLDSGDFLDWANEFLAMATPVGTAPCILPILGTWASPQICTATGAGAVSGATGAGILVINDTEGVLGSSANTLVYEGLIIVLGDGRFRLTGSSRIYGSVFMLNVLGNHSGETRLRVRDDSQICYSSLAIENANPAENNLLAWYEEYAQ